MSDDTISWAPVNGKWSCNGNKCTYNGPEDTQHQVGVALSSKKMRNGTISVKIKLNDPEKDSGRLLFGYNANSESYFSIGLCGYGYAYLIDEFIAGVGWRAIKSLGSKSNLSTSSYQVKVRICGQLICLTVNGVELIKHQLSHHLSGNQVGLFGWGPGGVVFEAFQCVGDISRAFVVMQFAKPYDTLYKEVIKPVCEKCKIQPLRADDIMQPGVIINDIVTSIIESDIIIAEISPSNANVFYELGYAHALKKEVVLLARRGGKLPFDISGYRVIFYDDTIGEKTNVENALENHLSNILEMDGCVRRNRTELASS